MKYYCIKQHDITDCGAACLATISKQYGLKISISRIREMAGTDRQGTNVVGMVKAAEKLGFTAKAVKGDRNALTAKFSLPAIAHVVKDGGLLHYVVIHKITKSKLVIADPAIGITKVSINEFLSTWTGIMILLVPSDTFEKNNKDEGTISRFFKLLLPQKKLLIDIFIASVVYTALGIGASFYFKVMMDEIVPNGLEKTLHVVSIGIILLYLFQILLSAFRTHMMIYLGQRLDISFVLGYYFHVLKLPMSFFSSRKTGEIISRFADASGVRNAVTSATLTIMIDTLMAVIGGIILYMQNASMFGIAFIILILYAIIVVVFNKPLKDINRTVMENNSQLTSYLVESLNGIETIKSYNAERTAGLESEKKFIKCMRSSFKNGFINNLAGSISGFLSMVGGTAILWIGAYKVIRAEITMGELITFNALLGYFLSPVQNLINLQPMMQTAVVAAERLNEILDIEAENKDNKKYIPSNLKGDIEFNNITFRYGTRRPVLKNINIHINRGEKVAFVGKSGSGKTTLAKLLLNFYCAESGEIQINGMNIKDIDLDYLRDKIAYIPQDTFLFSGTILENLSLGMEEVNMEEIVAVTKMAKCFDFINDLPMRFETIIGENGADLSGGQRQRLAIARTLLKHPEILIMDEATSNLDSITEQAIEHTIQECTDGITTIIIAHRMSTIKHCDRIYVIEKGEVVESGNHENLLNMNGVYACLYNEQTL